jgi:glutamate N-acetyltransferase/amino-acid N-acetyltransferase
VFDEDKAKKILSEKEIKVNIVIREGDKSATAWGCDLSYEYVKINGDYRS